MTWLGEMAKIWPCGEANESLQVEWYFTRRIAALGGIVASREADENKGDWSIFQKRLRDLAKVVPRTEWRLRLMSLFM
jgi:hypothetical protein